MTIQKKVTPQEDMENLLNAVVAQAAKDYRSACRKLRKKPDDKSAIKMKQDAENFFSTDRVRIYTRFSGEKLLHLLEEEQRELDRQEELKKQEELKRQEEMNGCETTA